MHKLKPFLLLFLFITIVFILFLVIKPGSVKRQTERFTRNFIRELKPDREFFNEHTRGLYRVYVYRDSICCLSDKGIYFTDTAFSGIREMSTLPAKGNLFYFKVSGDSLFYLNYDTKTLHVDYNNTHIADTIKGFASNCIFQCGTFFYDVGIKDVKEEGKSKFLIHSFSPSSGKRRVIADFKGITSVQTRNFKECLENTFEGNFFDLGADKWMFLFYRAGYFIFYDGNSCQLHQTIDKKPFREYNLRKIKVGDMTAYVCHSDDETTANFAAAADEKNIYVLSGTSLISKDTGWHCSIDVYDKDNRQYKYSYFVPFESKESFATNLVVYKNWLYLHINEMGLRRYKIK